MKDFTNQSNRGKQISKRNEALLNHLYDYINDVGKASRDEIAKELFGKINNDTKKQAVHITTWLREKLKKEGILFYVVDHKYQFLDSEHSYLQCSLSNQKRWSGYTKNIQNIVFSGIAANPQLRTQLAQMLGEMQVATLLPNKTGNDSSTENSNK